MSETFPTRAQSASAIALALVTVLALLVAPVCGSLCAARNCSAGMSHAHCHDMASMSATSGAQFAAQGKTCAGADLTAVLVMAGDQTFLFREGRITSAPVTISVLLEQGFASLQTSPSRGRPYRVSVSSRDSLRLTTILRI
ncbi:MAG: hypothetical protein WBE13_03745 [Candidatus Acidiferrum sp.]